MRYQSSIVRIAESPPVVWLGKIEITGKDAQWVIRLRDSSYDRGHGYIRHFQIYTDSTKKQKSHIDMLSDLANEEVYKIVFSLPREQWKEAYDLVTNLKRDSFLDGEFTALYGKDWQSMNWRKTASFEQTQMFEMEMTRFPDCDVSKEELAHHARNMK